MDMEFKKVIDDEADDSEATIATANNNNDAKASKLAYINIHFQIGHFNDVVKSTMHTQQ